MIEANVEIDQAAMSHMTSLLRDVAYYMPERLAAETQRAAIYVCNSLRARTIVAPKRIRKEEYSATLATKKPLYAHSNSDHHKLLRRWVFTRKIGMPGEYSKLVFVYTKAKRRVTKRTAQVTVSAHKRRTPTGRTTNVTAHRRSVKVAVYKMAGRNSAQEIRELWRVHGGIQHRGLAKKSWGWAAQKIYHNGAARGDLSWKHGKKDRRDPRHYVRGMFFKTGNGAAATIDNNLDYAYYALPPGGLEDAIRAAAQRMRYNLEAAFLRAFDRAGGGMNAPRKWGGSASSYWFARASEAGVIRFT